MLCYPYNSKEHVIVKNELWNWLKRQFPTRALCVIYHRLYQTFTISEHVQDGQVTDVMHLENSLTNFTRETAFILHRLLTQNREYRREIGRALSTNEQRTTDRRQDTEMQKTERWERHRSTRVSVGYQGS